MFHCFLLKMFVRIFCANCVPFGLLYIKFNGVFMFVCTHSCVSDTLFLCDCLFVSMYRLPVGDVRMFFVYLPFLIGLFFRLSVFLWTLFPVPCCLLYTRWLSTQALRLFFKSCAFMPEDGRIDRNM